MARLEDWAVGCSSKLAYVAPECRPTTLTGQVFNHPRKPDGMRIRTTRIMSASGRVVLTESGTTYLLGRPSAEYVEYLAKQGRTLDEAQPIKVVRS